MAWARREGARPSAMRTGPLGPGVRVARLAEIWRGAALQVVGSLRTSMRKSEVTSLGGPGEGDAEEAAVEQERMGGALGLGERGAVGAIDGGEEGVFAVGVEPAFANGFAGEAHGVGRLMAGDAGAAVGAEGYEEWVAAGAEGAVGIGDAEETGRVVVFAIPGEELLLVGLPPGVGRPGAG